MFTEISRAGMRIERHHR